MVIFMDKKMIERINELAKKKKSEGLTEAETAEQKELYKKLAESMGKPAGKKSIFDKKKK